MWRWWPFRRKKRKVELPEPERFVEERRRDFYRVHEAWNQHDLEALKAHVAGAVFDDLRADLKILDRQRVLNRIEGLRVERAELVETWQAVGHDFATVRFQGRLADLTLDAATGAKLEGGPEPLDEYWTFIRPQGVKGEGPWLLSSVQRPR